MNFQVIPEWWEWSLTIGLAVGLVSLELGKKPTRRILRVSALLLGLLGLVGLYFEPTIASSRQVGTVVVETTGADADTIDSLQQLGHEKIGVDEIPTHSGENFIVIGDGLESWQIPETSYAYLPAVSTTEGILDIHADQAYQNARLSIKGTIKLNAPTNLILNLAGQELQERELTENDSHFEFSIFPKTEGHQVVKLIATRDEDTLFVENLPLAVRPSPEKNVLFLTSTPTFEFRFLKNHLLDLGFGVAERVQISDGVYRDSFTGMKRQPLSRISDKVLREFKMVIMDGTTYSTLSRAGKNALTSRLRTGELGVLWFGDDEFLPMTTKESEPFEFLGESGKVELETRMIQFSNSDLIEFADETIGSKATSGLGKVVMPNVKETYQLMLMGEERGYAELWEVLLDPIVGGNWIEPSFSSPSLVFVNEPMEMIVSAPSDYSVNDTRLALSQRWHTSGQFRLKHWPNTQGWNKLDRPDTSFYFYASSPMDWQARRGYLNQKRTSILSSSGSGDSQQMPIQKPISPWIFYAMVLVGFAAIWIEGRLG